MPNITLTESAPVTIKFQAGDFTDALHFANQADRDQYSDEQIEAMCQARYDNWLALINAPRPEPTAEQIAAQVDAMVEQQRITQDQIVALSPDNVLMPILEGQAAVIAEQIATLTASALLDEAAGRG